MRFSVFRSFPGHRWGMLLSVLGLTLLLLLVACRLSGGDEGAAVSPEPGPSRVSGVSPAPAADLLDEPVAVPAEVAVPAVEPVVSAPAGLPAFVLLEPEVAMTAEPPSDLVAELSPELVPELAPGDAPGPSPEPVSLIPAPPPGGWDGGAMLSQALLGMEQAGSYRYGMLLEFEVSLGAPGDFPGVVPEDFPVEVTVEVEGEVLLPDRRGVVMVLGLGGFGVEVEARQVGDEVYLRDPLSGVWMLDDADDEAEDSGFLFMSGGFLSVEAMQDVRHEGIDGLPGGLAHRISVRLDPSVLGDGLPGPGLDAAGQLVEYWVGVDDSRLLRVRLAVDSEDGALTLLADFRDYGAPLVIEAPEIPELNIPEPDAGGLDS